LGYKSELEGLCQKTSTSNVFFVDPVPADEVVKYLGDANVAVHLYAPKLLMLKYCSSNKIFQYLAAGLPIICSNVLRSVREATDGYEVCYWVDPNNIKDLEMALQKVLALSSEELKEINRRAKLCVREKCCWEAQEGRFLEVYHNL
jgi:glycosyltransferase involved in cell wall biosynthesis